MLTSEQKWVEQQIQAAFRCFVDELGNRLEQLNCDMLSPSQVVDVVREAADRARYWRSLGKRGSES